MFDNTYPVIDVFTQDLFPAVTTSLHIVTSSVFRVRLNGRDFTRGELDEPNSLLDGYLQVSCYCNQTTVET